MKKNVLLSTLLIAGLLATCSVAKANGATTAEQTVTATLYQIKEVVTNGGNLAATIDETTGLLSTALTPGFTLSTNSSASTPVEVTALANTTGGLENALDSTGSFIALTNSTSLPAPTAVGDALSGAPAPASNANVIAYTVNPPADVAGQLAFSWNGLDRWTGNLTHKGSTNTSVTIPANTPRAATFSLDDVDGSYQATITLSFVSSPT